MSKDGRHGLLGQRSDKTEKVKKHGSNQFLLVENLYNFRVVYNSFIKYQRKKYKINF